MLCIFSRIFNSYITNLYSVFEVEFMKYIVAYRFISFTCFLTVFLKIVLKTSFDQYNNLFNQLKINSVSLNE